MERRAMQMGLWMIVFAVLWKAVSGGGLQAVTQKLKEPSVAAFLLYLETGRVVPLETEPTTQPTAAAPTRLPTAPPTEATAPPKQPLQFAPEDGLRVELFNATSYGADMHQLVTKPLRWDLTGEGAKVLILHTHATESYTKAGESYAESGSYRTLEEQHNMVSVGEALKRVLESYGIGVIHDRTLHDYPNYTGSYNASRKTAERPLRENPGIVLILDLHRDAVELSNGRQMDTSAKVNGQEAAQLMLVMGSDAGGLTHPAWRENLAVAVQLHAQLEGDAPGLMRPLYLRKERFNQDLLPGMLLVEVGSAGNTHAEALAAAEALGHAIGAMRYGTN